MSVLRDRERASTREYFAYFADPYGFTRTIVLYLWDAVLELRAARRQRKHGEDHVDRGGLYPLMRGWRGRIGATEGVCHGAPQRRRSRSR